MSLFTKTANDTFAPYNSDGTPRAIVPQDAQIWGTEVEVVINAFTSNGGLIYSSKAALDADLARGANSMAWVMGDATVGNNGIYRKIGASGTGSWTRVSDLPFSFIIASDAGAGTANAIQATTSIPVSSSALVWMNIFEANTASPVTVSFNGGAPLTIKTNSGGNVVAGGLVAGTIVMGIASGGTFRLVSDQASAAVVAAAEAAADRAEAAAAAIGIVYYGEARHIKQYCPANGIDDDGPGLAAALNSGYPIIGDGTVLNVQTQAQVNVTSFGASLKGWAGPVGGEIPVYGLKIRSPLNNPLRVRCSQFRCEGVTFENLGTVKDAAFQAVVVDREDTGINTDDIDAYFVGNAFKDYGVSVRQNGRGITFHDNLIANSADGWVGSFPTTGTEGDPIQSDGTLGFRANSFQRNRGHNISNLVRVTGSILMHGAIIAGNDVDLGDTVFTGGIRDSTIANNVCRFSEGREGMIYITGGGSYMSIVGNVGGGGTLAGAMAGTTMIEFETGADVFGTTIVGNVGRNYAWHLVSFTNSLAQACVIQGNSGHGLGRDGINLGAGSFGTIVANNSLRDYGLDGTSRAGLRLTGAQQRLNVLGNQFAPVLATARNVLAIGTPTLTKCLIKDNQGHYATEFITGAFANSGSTIADNII